MAIRQKDKSEPSKVIGSISKLAGTLVGTAVVTGKRIIKTVSPSKAGSLGERRKKTPQAPGKKAKKAVRKTEGLKTKKKIAKRKSTGPSQKTVTPKKKAVQSPAKKKKSVTPRKKVVRSPAKKKKSVTPKKKAVRSPAKKKKSVTPEKKAVQSSVKAVQSSVKKENTTSKKKLTNLKTTKATNDKRKVQKTTTKITAKNMNMTEIKKRARSVGIAPGKTRKVDLVRAIQTAENCEPCFGTSNGQCERNECCFMEDCLKIISDEAVIEKNDEPAIQEPPVQIIEHNNEPNETIVSPVSM